MATGTEICEPKKADEELVGADGPNQRKVLECESVRYTWQHSTEKEADFPEFRV